MKSTAEVGGGVRGTRALGRYVAALRCDPCSYCGTEAEVVIFDGTPSRGKLDHIKAVLAQIKAVRLAGL